MFLRDENTLVELWNDYYYCSPRKPHRWPLERFGFGYKDHNKEEFLRQYGLFKKITI
jgi:hypothetical protein